MLTEKITMRTETVFSDDRLNRYLLRKEWDSKKPRATIIMTNPSAADLLTLDYTTLYILNNISRLDFGAVDIVNMTSRITTKLNVKEDLNTELEAVNAEFIVKSAEKSDVIIIAWGKLGENNEKVRQVESSILTLLLPYKDKLRYIASEKGDYGFHPLAPQIRFQWILKELSLEAEQEAMKEEQPASNPAS
ncbi:MAG: DUF1643 domain-containing protein [Synergistaceae bacterium]|nr:DUF1643 domain-containing protein [Synergistaceae bacterium]